MIDSESQGAALLPRRTPWLLWGTLGWALLTLIAWQVLVIPAMAYLAGGFDLPAFESTARTSTGIAATLWLGLPIHVAMIALATRLRRWTFAEYLALVAPSRRHLLLGAIVLLVMLPLGDATSWLFGRPIVPEFMTNIYRSGRDNGTFWIAAAAIIIAAPIFEELLFRGFMFRGVEASRLGVAGAIVLPSLLWAAMHIQYDLFNIVQIFVIGCVFAWLRWKSGSTILTILMHMTVNATAVAQAIYWVEYAVAG